MCQTIVTLKVLQWSVTAYREDRQHVIQGSDTSSGQQLHAGKSHSMYLYAVTVLKWSVTACRKCPQHVIKCRDYLTGYFYSLCTYCPLHRNAVELH